MISVATLAGCLLVEGPPPVVTTADEFTACVEEAIGPERAEQVGKGPGDIVRFGRGLDPETLSGAESRAVFRCAEAAPDDLVVEIPAFFVPITITTAEEFRACVEEAIGPERAQQVGKGAKPITLRYGPGLHPDDLTEDESEALRLCERGARDDLVVEIPAFFVPTTITTAEEFRSCVEEAVGPGRAPQIGKGAKPISLRFGPGLHPDDLTDDESQALRLCERGARDDLVVDIPALSEKGPEVEEFRACVEKAIGADRAANVGLGPDSRLRLGAGLDPDTLSHDQLQALRECAEAAPDDLTVGIPAQSLAP